MNIVFAWLILGAVVAALSFVVPVLDSYGDYWEAWRSWNLFIWGILIGAFALSAGIVWSLAQLGALG